MKIRYALLSLVLVATQIHAQGVSFNEESVDLDALYEQIDDAISQSSHYVAERERKIAACRDSLLMQDSLEKRVQTAEKLFLLYKPYKNDSAQYYAELCIGFSETMNRPDLAGRYRSMLALQCSNTDMVAESLELLRLVKRSALDKRGLVDYYNAWMHAYGELVSFTQRQDMHQFYLDQQNIYRDSVMMVAEEGSEEWCHLKMDILTAKRHFQDALKVSNQWLKKVYNHSHEKAYAAFYRSMVYENLHNHDLTCYWFGISALEDIHSGVMSQASLLFLAEKLVEDGDYERAMRYMEFCRSCNLTFNPNLRAYQLKSIIHVIEKDRDATQDRLEQMMIVAGILVLILLLALIIVIVRKRKRNQA
jgi:hypothetical protein